MTGPAFDNSSEGAAVSASTSDWVVASVVFAASLALLLATMGIGIPRDESFYFHAADVYIGWFEELWRNVRAGRLAESFTKASVDEHLSYNREHPALMKVAFALSERLWHDALGWLDRVTALRLPGAAAGAATVALTFVFARQLFGTVAGLAAAGALLFQPRFFFHAHLACFDVPITGAWLGTVYAYWRSHDSTGWAAATGALFGLGLCTKLNALFLPVVLGVHWLGAHWHEFRAIRVSDGWRLRVPAVPTAFVWMAVLGPVIWYALTPWYWFDTWARVKWYLEFHLQHVNYFVQYFGENVQNPPLPISYPWVMTAVTVPAAILVAAAVGGGRAWREWDGRAWVGRWSQAVRDLRLPRSLGARPATGWLLVLNLLFPIVLISLPSVPIFGGTKHWMTAMPFLAIFAGGGVGCAAGTVAEAIDERVGSVPRPAGLALAGGLCLTTVLGPSAYATAHIHPFETGYYNSLIGSVRGAADAGMLRQFWGYASRQGLPWLNEHAPKGAQVWTGNTTGYAWWFYQDAGWARGDLRRGSRAGSDFGLFHHQKSFAADRVELWSEYGTYTPEHVVSVEGVPMLSIYARPGTDESSGSP